MIDRFVDGDPVTVVVHAEFVRCEAGRISLALPGVDDVFDLPIVNDVGGALDAVIVSPAVPVVFPGDVWRSRRAGVLLLATIATGNDPAGVLLVDPGHRAFRVEDAIAEFGVLDLIVAEDQDGRAVMYHLPAPAGGDAPLYESTRAEVGPQDPADPPWPGFLPAVEEAVLDGEVIPAPPALPGPARLDETAALPAIPPEREPEAVAR